MRKKWKRIIIYAIEVAVIATLSITFYNSAWNDFAKHGSKEAVNMFLTFYEKLKTENGQLLLRTVIQHLTGVFLIPGGYAVVWAYRLFKLIKRKRFI